MKVLLTYHITALVHSVSLLSRRGFLIYFGPPVLITLAFYTFIELFPNLLFPKSFFDSGCIASAFSKIGEILRFLLTQFYVFIVLTILSPFNALLSEKIDSACRSKLFSSDVVELCRKMIRAFLIVIIIMFIQLFVIFFWWLFMRIFGLQNSFVYNIGAFCISAFFFGFSFYDYSLERYGRGVFASLKFAFSNWIVLILTGTIFKILYYLPYLGETPYIGIIIAPVLTSSLSTIVYLYLHKIPDQEIVKNIKWNST